MKQIKKISVKSVYGNIDVKKFEAQAQIPLMRVVGYTDGFRLVATQFGESIGFTGLFQAINAETGEIFRSAEMFVPSIIERPLIAALKKSAGGASITVAFDLLAGPCEKGNTGYEYLVGLIQNPDDGEDPITAIESRLGISRAAIPAMTEDSAPAESEVTAPRPGRKTRAL